MHQMEYVKELLKQTLKNSKACCCTNDATFECRKCQLVSQDDKYYQLMAPGR